jgi:hypothetical protein
LVTAGLWESGRVERADLLSAVVHDAFPRHGRLRALKDEVELVGRVEGAGAGVAPANARPDLALVGGRGGFVVGRAAARRETAERDSEESEAKSVLNPRDHLSRRPKPE